MLAFEYFHRNIADGVACMYETAISTPIQVYSLLCMHKSAHAYILLHTHRKRQRYIHADGAMTEISLSFSSVRKASFLFVYLILTLAFLAQLCSMENVVSVAFIRIEQCAIRPTILYNTIQSMPSHLVLKSSEYDGVLKSQPTKIDVKHKFYQPSSPDHHASAKQMNSIAYSKLTE